MVTVSGKIPAEQRDKLRRYGVNVSKLIQGAVDCEIRGIEEEEIGRALDEAAVVLRKIPDEHIIGAIRAGRDER